MCPQTPLRRHHSRQLRFHDTGHSPAPSHTEHTPAPTYIVCTSETIRPATRHRQKWLQSMKSVPHGLSLGKAWIYYGCNQQSNQTPQLWGSIWLGHSTARALCIGDFGNARGLHLVTRGLLQEHVSMPEKTMSMRREAMRRKSRVPSPNPTGIVHALWHSVTKLKSVTGKSKYWGFGSPHPDSWEAQCKKHLSTGGVTQS